MSAPKVGSLFAGIGGFDLGFERAGFEVAWCVEYDRHAQSVLRRRFPRAEIHGDIRQVDPTKLAPVDVVCGGFPCQDLSTAGKRRGLEGDRSGLFYDAIGIVRTLRPRLVVLENVVGLLSSNHGHDFAAVLREMAEGGDISEVAWRVLDSQHFGVAQRRRRVFIVGSRRHGCAEQVLDFSEGGARDTAEGGKTREADFANIACGIAADRVCNSVTSKWAKGTGGPSGDECQNLIVANPVKSVLGDISHTLTASHASKDGTGRGTPIVCVPVGVDLYNGSESGNVSCCMTLATGTNGGSGPKVRFGSLVRRIMPIEAERLQGFPDDWTAGQSDSHRYRQLGNAVTVNVAEWIARRAAQALKEDTN